MVSALHSLGDLPSVAMHVCGFGPITACARAARLIAEHRPEHVLLIGIAGSLSDRVAIGRAYTFASVTCEGIGVGWGEQYRSAESLGWPQLDAKDPHVPVIADRIDGLVGDAAQHLLSVCAACADTAAASLRRERHPDADAEDMEGFGVAVSCQLAAVPLTIIRGISNRAGNRDHAQWRVDEALASVAQLLVSTLRHPTSAQSARWTV